MAATFKKIASGTIGSAVTSYTISSVPNTYSVLELYLVTQTTSTSLGLQVELNGIGTTTYTYGQRYADSSGGVTSEFTNASKFNIYNCAGQSSNGSFSPLKITFTNSQTQTGGFGTSAIWRAGYANIGSGLAFVTSGVGSQTSMTNTSISSIRIIANAGLNISANSTWELYGIE